MDRRIEVRTPMPPSVNDYLGKRVIFINGKPIVQLFETNEARKFKAYVKNLLIRECKKNGWVKTDNLQYVVCEVVAYMPQKKRDADNIFKCLLDAFKDSEIVFHDDCMVIPRVENIFIDPKNPRLEISMYLSEKIGVFKNKDEMNKFCLKNCFNCKKFKTYDYRCKQLRNCLENKIIDEVDLSSMTCLEKK